MLPTLLTAALFSAAAVTASPALDIRAGPGCNGDNLLNCFKTSSAPASAYCSTFLAASTVTVTAATVTPSTTVTGTTSTTTQVLETTTSTSTQLTTTTFTSTTINTLTYVASTVTAVITSTAQAIPKRALEKRATTSITCLFSTYPASRISSACTCLGVTQPPVSTVTATATASTVTAQSTVVVIQTVTSTVSTTTTTTSTTTESTTLSQTALVPTTTTETGAATITPRCTVVGNSYGNLRFSQYYKGSGTTENINNPGNTFQYRPAQSTTIPPKPACSAVQDCAEYLGAIRDYYSFDLHFLKSQNVWECRAFYDRNRDPSYFNVPGGNFGDAYGYSF